jgi:pre-mRNA-splicing helicase BRR2
MYRRLIQNPNFYNLAGRTAEHINDYLSELIENTVASLGESKCVNLDSENDTLSSTNLGLIASFYNIKC